MEQNQAAKQHRAETAMGLPAALTARVPQLCAASLPCSHCQLAVLASTLQHLVQCAHWCQVGLRGWETEAVLRVPGLDK